MDVASKIPYIHWPGISRQPGEKNRDRIFTGSSEGFSQSDLKIIRPKITAGRCQDCVTWARARARVYTRATRNVSTTTCYKATRVAWYQ